MNNSTITELEKLRDSYLTKAEALRVSIDILKEERAKEQPKAEKPIQSSSPSANSLVDKVLATIDKSGRFIKKGILDTENKDLSPDAIRSTITYLKQKGLIISIKANANNVNTFWGRKEWIENGKPKQQYMYNENEVIRK